GSFMGVGGALGALLTSWLLMHVNWRYVFVLYAMPGFVWAGWFFWWYRDRPGEHRSVNRDELHLIQGGAALNQVKFVPIHRPMFPGPIAIPPEKPAGPHKARHRIENKHIPPVDVHQEPAGEECPERAANAHETA